MITVAVINESTILSTTEVQHAVAALDHQVQADFTPHWGVTARVRFYPQHINPPADAWVLAILDDSDQAGALGYHDLTANGYPIGRVFARTDADYGLSWTVTASHELLEMLADPDCALAAQLGTKAVFVAREIGDPVESDQWAYLVGDVLVSDFVLPSWFQRQAHKPFDFGGHLHSPLTLLPGGYVSIWTPKDTWTQKTARPLPGVVSRIARSQRNDRRLRGSNKASEITGPITGVAVESLL